MRKKVIIRIMAYVFTTVILMGNSTMKALATSNVDYEDRFVTISENDLFTNMKDLLPGGVAENTVALNNKSARSITFYLYAKPSDSTYNQDLLKIIELTVSRGGTVIYRGPASGNPNDALAGQTVVSSMILDPSTSLYGINLGTILPGNSMNLTASISIPGEDLGNEYQNESAMVDWVFLAEGEDEQATTTDDDDDDDDDETTETTATLFDISDEDIPLDSPDVTIEITDEDIPLNPLPKTGSRVLYITEVSIILAVLVTGLIVIKRIEKKRV